MRTFYHFCIPATIAHFVDLYGADLYFSFDIGAEPAEQIKEGTVFLLTYCLIKLSMLILSHALAHNEEPPVRENRDDEKVDSEVITFSFVLPEWEPDLKPHCLRASHNGTSRLYSRAAHRTPSVRFADTSPTREAFTYVPQSLVPLLLVRLFDGDAGSPAATVRGRISDKPFMSGICSGNTQPYASLVGACHGVAAEG